MNNFFLNFLKKEDPFATNPLTSKKQTEEALNFFSPAEENEMRNLIASSSKDLWPHPNHDVEFVVPLFNARKHYKHLKKMMWKHQRR